MLKFDKVQTVTLLVTLLMLGCACGPTSAAVRIAGRVEAGGSPLASSIVTLWGATAADPRQLTQTRTSSDGRFELASQDSFGADVILYVIAEGGETAANKGSGDNPATALLAVLGNTKGRPRN